MEGLKNMGIHHSARGRGKGSKILEYQGLKCTNNMGKCEAVDAAVGHQMACISEMS